MFYLELSTPNALFHDFYRPKDNRHHTSTASTVNGKVCYIVDHSLLSVSLVNPIGSIVGDGEIERNGSRLSDKSHRGSPLRDNRRYRSNHDRNDYSLSSDHHELSNSQHGIDSNNKESKARRHSMSMSPSSMDTGSPATSDKQSSSIPAANHGEFERLLSLT